MFNALNFNLPKCGKLILFLTDKFRSSGEDSILPSSLQKSNHKLSSENSISTLHLQGHLLLCASLPYKSKSLPSISTLVSLQFFYFFSHLISLFLLCSLSWGNHLWIYGTITTSSDTHYCIKHRLVTLKMANNRKNFSLNISKPAIS